MRVAHQFRVEHCFIAMLLFLALPIHISFSFHEKCHSHLDNILEDATFYAGGNILSSVTVERGGGGGGGRVLHNVLGLKAYTSHFLLSSQ